MTAPKRMALAFGCMVVAVVVPSVPRLLASVQLGWHQVLINFKSVGFLVLISSSGWLMFLPFILLFEDAEGSRFLQLLCIGAVIGPLIMFTLALFITHGHLSSLYPVYWVAIVGSAWTSFLPTLLYVLTLQYFTRRRKTVAA